MRNRTIGCLIAILSGPTLAAADDGFAIQDQDGKHLDVLHQGRIVARYMYAYDPSSPERLHTTYKPYLHVFDREGKGPITKGPGGQYTHHRGIFVGWNRLGFGGKKYDRWHMKGGEQVHKKFLLRKASGDRAEVRTCVHWNDNEGNPIVEEERAFTFRSPPEGAYVVVDLATTIKASAGDVELNGDPEHAGIQYRPANEVDRNATIYVFPKEDANPRKDVDYSWVGETYTLNGKQYSVVIMNHPDNPKGTRFSAYRNYGRFGAFPVAKIAKGESRTFRYRFLVAEGAMLPAGRIQASCNAFTGAKDPTPKTRTIPTGGKKK